MFSYGAGCAARPALAEYHAARDVRTKPIALTWYLPGSMNFRDLDGILVG